MTDAASIEPMARSRENRNWVMVPTAPTGAMSVSPVARDDTTAITSANIRTKNVVRTWKPEQQARHGHDARPRRLTISAAPAVPHRALAGDRVAGGPQAD